MSDKNSKDRRTSKWQGSGPPPAPRSGRSGNRTVLGMTNAGSDPPRDYPAAEQSARPASRPPVARPGLSGRTPGQSEEPRTLTGMPKRVDADADVPDTMYMEPPSESFSNAQTRPQPVPPQRRPAPTAASASHPYSDAEQSSRSGPTPGRRSELASSPYNANAPESWRSAARNVAKRSSSARPGPKSDSQHLRLKYDDVYDDYRGVPKTRLPVMVLAFLFLLAAAGGGAYWAQDHGGLVALAQQLQKMLQAKLYGHEQADEPGPADETATGAVQPPANPGSEAPATTAPATTPAATAQPTAAAPVQPAAPSSAAPAAANPAAAAKDGADEAARSLADPDAPSEAAPAAAAAKAPEEAAKPAPVAKAPADKPAPKPVATKPAARPEPLRPIVRHEPVIKIRDLSSPPAPGAPPEPADMPYIPPPIEPPAPDEPR